MGAYYCTNCEAVKCHHETTVNICDTCDCIICDDCTVYIEVYEKGKEDRTLCDDCYVKLPKKAGN